MFKMFQKIKTSTYHSIIFLAILQQIKQKDHISLSKLHKLFNIKHKIINGLFDSIRRRPSHHKVFILYKLEINQTNSSILKIPTLQQRYK